MGRNAEVFEDNQTYVVIGAAMAVHRELGKGFSEAVYQDALAIELARQEIPFVREQRIFIYYKDHQLPSYYTADFVCFDNIIVELKAIEYLTNRETAQVLNYLKATRFPKALLINFGESSFNCKRFVGESNYHKEQSEY